MEKLIPEEIRVLGVLLEKESLTPEYYPLTLNSLVNACNQKTSRDPVVEYEDETVETALEMLQARGLVSWVHQAGSRVRKFKHNVTSHLELYEPAERAILCVLLLRGAQTMGEIRQRTGRMHTFASLEDVVQTLQTLQMREEPLVKELAKIPGRKERRFGHTLTDQVSEVLQEAAPLQESSHGGLPSSWQAQLDTRDQELREEIQSLRDELEALRNTFEDFKKQFD